MKFLLVIVSLSIFSLNKAYADDFTFTGDSSQNGFYSTISYLVNRADIQNLNNSGNNISFNMGDVYGKENLLIGNEVFSIFFNNGYWRENGVNEGTYVSVPPMGSAEVVYQYWNNSGHDVNISEIVVAYSKSNQERIPLNSFLEFSFGQEFPGQISFLYGGLSRYREGLFREYDGVGKVGNGEYGFKVLDRLAIKQPLEILDINTKKTEKGIQILVTVRNNSFDNLDSLVLSHNEVSLNFSLLANEEKILEYFLPNSEPDEGEVVLGNLFIENNQSLRKCSVQGTNFSPEFDKNAVSAFSYREDGGWIVGALIGPSQESFCIDRVPYIISSGPIVFSSEQGVVLEGDGNSLEGKEVEVELEEVLGVRDSVFILPRTSLFPVELIFGSVLLLVLDGFLWYSVFRKGKNEYKNTFTKLCSKSWSHSSKRRL